MTIPAYTIRKAAEATAKREIASQKEQYRHFGIMADWSPESTYRTLGKWIYAINNDMLIAIQRPPVRIQATAHLSKNGGERYVVYLHGPRLELG